MIVFYLDQTNPAGMKMDDTDLIKTIQDVVSVGATVVFDSPYRKHSTLIAKDEL